MVAVYGEGIAHISSIARQGELLCRHDGISAPIPIIALPGLSHLHRQTCRQFPKIALFVHVLLQHQAQGTSVFRTRRRAA